MEKGEALELMAACMTRNMKGLTFEFTRVRKRAKPAVARRVERRVSGTSHYLYFAAVMN